MRAREILEADNFKIAGDISRYGRQEKAAFHVIHHDDARHVFDRPLVIIVHPGDMIEHGAGFGNTPEGIEQSVRVRAISQQRQSATARQVREWREFGADVVVLHRESCTQFNGRNASRHADQDLKLEIKTAWSSGTVLFGDDLDKAAAWMISNLGIAERPHVYLSGAYADPEYGCITAIGKALERVIGSDRITVSEFSHISGDDRWKPGS